MTVNKDITADYHSSEKKILDELNHLILDFRRRGDTYSNIKVQDIQRIIHVVDLDAAFIPENNIKKGDTEYYEYYDDSMIVRDVQIAIGRNRKKSSIIKKLVETTQIGNIPYHIYFVSCNMDHLLFNDRMPSRNRKKNNAWIFQEMCKKTPKFLEKILFNERLVSKDYYGSWEEIQKGIHSLQRKTNMNLFLNETKSATITK